MEIAAHYSEASDRLAQKLAGRVKFLNIAWIILSITLLGTGVGLIAGAWNLYVIFGKWRLPEMITRKSPSALASYDSDRGSWLIWIAINLALGGGIGAILIAYEYFFVRAQVLKNRHLFDGPS